MQAVQILLADGHVACGVTGAGVVDEHLEMHLRLAAEAVDVGEEVPLVGADGAAQSLVVSEGGVEAEGQDG
jgi:prepilin-type processing-associated H-X9-DG protein